MGEKKDIWGSGRQEGEVAGAGVSSRLKCTWYNVLARLYKPVK